MGKKKKRKRTPIVTSEATLREFMKKILVGYNNEGVEIGDSTKHDEVLSDSEPPPPLTEAFAYQATISVRLHRDTGKSARWPSPWITRTVSSLAKTLWKSVSS